MTDGTPLPSYPPRVLTKLLGHDIDNQVGLINVADVAVKRIVLTAAKTFYINADSGIDTADRGLTAGTPWQSPGYAQRFVAQNYDLNGQFITFQLANATAAYTQVDGLTSYAPSAGNSKVYWRGNPTTPASVKWQSTTTTPVLRLGLELVTIATFVNGFEFSNPYESIIDATRQNASCTLGNAGTADVINNIVKSVPSQFYIFEGSMGQGGNLTVDWTGNSNTPFSLFESGDDPNRQSFHSGPITIIGNPTFLGGLFTGKALAVVLGNIVSGAFVGKSYSRAYIRNHKAGSARNNLATGASTLLGDIDIDGGGYIAQSGATTYWTRDGVFADGIQTVSPASGATITVAETEGEININGAGTIAALTIALKANAYDNEIITIRANVRIDSVGWSGGAFAGAPSGLEIGETRLRYDLATAKWYANSGSISREKLTADRAYYVRFNLGACTMTIASPAVVTRAAHGLSIGDQVVFSLPLDARPNTAFKITSITIANPGVVTANSHGYVANDPIIFRTSGALPSGITAGAIYYVRNPTTNTFEFSATSGGASIETTGAQSGVQRIERASSLPTGVTEGRIYYVLTVPTTDTFTFAATAGGAAINTTGTQAGKITLQTGNNNNTGLVYSQATALMTVQAAVNKVQLLDFNARRVTIYLDASVYTGTAGAYVPVIEIYNQSASVSLLGGITAAIGSGQLYIRGLDDNDHSKAIIRSPDYNAMVVIGFQSFGIAVRKIAFQSGPGEYAIRMDGPIGAHPFYIEHVSLLGTNPAGLINSHGVSMYLHGMVEVIANPLEALFHLGEASYFFYIAPGLDYFQGVIGFGAKTPPNGMFWATRNSTVYINNQARFTGVWNCPKCWLDAGAVFQHSLEDDNYGIEIPGTAPVILGGSSYVIDDQDSGLSTSVSGLTTLKLGGYGVAPALSLFGLTSGSATIKAAAVAGSPADLTLPTTSGSSGHFLQTDGSGVLSWAAGGGSGSPGGSTLQLQYHTSGGAFGGVAGSAVSAVGGLTLATGEVTTDNPILNLSQTWNGSGITFSGIKLTVTITASDVNTSKLMELNSSGTNMFSVFQNGGPTHVTVGPYLSINNDGGFTSGYNFMLRGAGGAPYYTGMLGIKNTWMIGWFSVDITTAIDTALWRQGAGIMALSQLTRAMGFRIYNTITVGSDYAPTDYERAKLDWTTTANVFTIGTEHSSGNVRDIALAPSSGVIRLPTGTIQNSGGGLLIQQGAGGCGHNYGGITCNVLGPFAYGLPLNMTLSNGLNSDYGAPYGGGGCSYMRVVGPTAAFSIGGIGNINAACTVLVIFNATSQAMTIVNEDASSATVNRITTLTGANVTLRTGNSLATFVYDTTSQRWMLVSYN